MEDMEITAENRKDRICELMSDQQYVPMKEKELAMLLQVSREDRQELRRLLEELLTEGRLTVDARGKYKKADGHTLTGTFISHGKGFGFVEIEGREDDLFIPAGMTAGSARRHRTADGVRRHRMAGGARRHRTAAEGRRTERLIGLPPRLRLGIPPELLFEFLPEHTLALPPVCCGF